MVLTSGIASLEEAGHEDLTDAVYLDAQRRHALDGYWSAVHPRVMDLHNHTISLSRAAVRHCYGEAFRSDVASASTPTPLLLQAAGADEEEAEAGMFEIIVGRGESLSPAVLRLLNEEFSPSQDARVRDDNPGRLQVPRQSIRAWMEARREGGLV